MVSKRLYIWGLPETVSGEQVAQYFSHYGRVTEVKLHDEYGFVEFVRQRDATVVLETYSTRPFLGCNLIVEYARPRRDAAATRGGSPDSADTAKSPPPQSPPIRGRLAPSNARLRYPIVVSNLSRRTRWQELKDFGRLGGGIVAFCDIDQTKHGRGFIEYLSQEDANYAVKTLNGRELCGSIVEVTPYTGKSCHKQGRPSSRSRSPSRRSRRERSGDRERRRSRSRTHGKSKMSKENRPLTSSTSADIKHPKSHHSHH
ncbi:hypothetical protein BJ322DRAFT_1110908 [Thelephora terrestris]|uniref:RRM domain-containing protein n=1 Tax=Thelephora terrestris TaxID=56493 RepID=A0A9P6HBB7_9AGAM|nr:hypothetical protein BJ322DRAFT_1110908 [Thelephora terrestris]